MNSTIKFFCSTFTIILSFSSSLLLAQDQTIVNWYDSERTMDEPFNISTDKVYDTIIKDKKGQTVIVAVIDSGVDVEHEDLDDVIWTNNDEIPDNGIDDDNNGYVDDINGWNFIGGSNGAQVDADTYEMTRTYARLREKYGDIEPSKLNEKEIEEYNLYTKYGQKIDKEVAAAKSNYESILGTEQIYKEVIDHVRQYVTDNEITAGTIDSLSMSYTRNGMIAANILNVFSQEIGYIPNVNEMSTLLLGELAPAKKHYGDKWMYNYNPDYDSREIVGDNYSDLDDRFYGNNSVEGPDAMHGTHVSGIIAAERNNKLGINGIAQNVKIMVLRAVPNGDERDKDVANAIRYAVDNGATVINMSFGKGESPQKQYVDDAVRYAAKRDVLLIHASGNSSANIDSSVNFPLDEFIKPKGFLFWKKKKADNWISVGASSKYSNENMIAEFSNYGKENVDLFAPGEYMLSTTPNDTYQVQQGTSMAAPVVSGVAALLRSYFPQLTAKQIKKVLIESSSPLDVLVKEPGSDKIVPFKDLSVSGGIIDLQSAFLKAGTVKGKKKISKKKIQA